MHMKLLVAGAAFAALVGADAANAGTAGRNNFGPFPDLGPVGNGRRIFLEYNCSQCHGNDAGGSGRAPNISQGESLDGVYNALMRGEPYGGMPSFANYLTYKDVKDIYAYLNNFGNKDQPDWTAWWQPVPKF
jgi:mono/diheme cytochrome c family protein